MALVGRGGSGNHAEVVIVGGGPAGSSLGVALARLGVSVLVLDRARFPRPKPCAEYLSPQASRILHALGVLEEVERSGAAQLAGMVVRAPNGMRVVGEFAGCSVKGFRDRGLSVRREVLDHILLRAAQAAGAEVRESVHVVDLIRDRGGRVRGVRTVDNAEITGDLVVGADGLRSVIARRLQLARSARWPRRYALVTHYRGVGEIGECGEMHVERGGFIGIADVGQGITTVALVVPSRRAKEFANGREVFLDRWLALRPQLADRFARATRVSPVVATGPFASRAKRAWSPGAALVGDAADFFDPFTGEGIYAALRGGELLAPFVVDALGADSVRGQNDALAAYDRRRRREFGGKWIVEWIIGAVVASPRLMNRASRVLARRKDMADLLVGVTGDFVPASAVLNARYILSLFVLPLSLAARHSISSTRD
ncbi:MAG TPA: FAD-dependent monooxygenase [Gemmatimonadaceae bacterium]|nr:FAD-dependent monooxygenase [Gemmatimonadaceae bacterium]